MLVRVFFFLLLLTTNSIANDFYNPKELNSLCDKKKSFNPRTDLIEIKVLKNKKWVENLLKIIVEFNLPNTRTDHENSFNFSIKDSYKKNFKAKVKINYKKNNISCEFNAKIKITGDGWWHLDWINGTPYASVQVKLIDGNIDNIVNFKLLLPKSRNKDNEIFIVSFLRYLKFIAPKTFYTNAKINGRIKKYIFQEDLNKELLESYSLIEGPIIEGDERFTVEKKFKGKSFYPFSLSRISNYKYVRNDVAKINKSLEAITLMNQIYIQSHLSSPHSIEKLNINSKIIENNVFAKDFNTYESLIYAMNAAHGQSHDDRRFYYDPINNYLLPIYYDGKPEIIDFENTTESLNYFLENIISIEAQKGALKAIDLINNINDKEMIKILNENGLSLNKKKYFDLKKKVQIRLKKIKDSQPKEIKFYNLNKYFNKFKDHDDILKLVFANTHEVEICNITLSNCEKQNISSKDISNLPYLFAQNFDFIKKNSNNKYKYLFIGKNKNYYENIKIDNFFKNKINKDFIVKHNDNIKLNINYENQILDIYQKNSYGRAVIYGKKISDWQVNFFGSKLEEEILAIKNYENLSGCVTFIDIKLIDVNLFAENSKCEDAMNLIRTEGKINDIKIFNSMYDGLDVDFSTLSINKLLVNGSKNDCVDFSFGKYKIEYSELSNCGDKGISVGEKSYADFNNIKVSNVNTGIASKDSSIVNVNNSKIENAKICLSAYRKKQEFGAASLYITNSICKNYNEKVIVDQNSTIDIKN